VETQYGIPGWAIADITKRLNIRPQYARLQAPGKREALHALYSPMQVIQIRADYDRQQRETKERREQRAKERFSSENQKKEYRSLRAQIITALERIEQRQARLEQALGLDPIPTFTKTPIDEERV
jgi:bisphosphoglycerate-dependent phosphoglycerate mutase